MLVTPFYKKVTKHYANRKTIGKQQKCCFLFFIIIFTKKMQGLSTNLFVLGRKFSKFVSMASSALGNFPTFLALDFSQLSGPLRKRLKFHNNVWQDLNILLNGLLDLSFYWVIISSIFRYSNTSFLSWIWLLYLK